MSIVVADAAPAAPAARSASAAHGLSVRWPLLLAALMILGLGLALRLWLLVRSGWLLEGDDSLSTLMALAVQAGDRPIMLKNQTYAAAWEPYLMALSFTLFGVSRAAAKLPELVQSLLLIPATAWLAYEVAGRRAAWISAALMAAMPAYDLVMSLKPWAPYTEVMLFGTLALAAAVHIAFRQPTWQQAAVCGMCGGLAFWMHPIAVYYLLPSGLVVLFSRPPLKVLGVALTAFLVGALPVLVYNLQTGGATFRFVAAGSGGQTADRWAVLSAWWNADLPRGAGLWHPWGPSSTLLGIVLALLLVVAVLLALVRRRMQPRPSDAVLLMLAGIPLLFVLSGFGGPALNPYGFDATGRYAPPLWTPLSVLAASLAAWLWSYRSALGASLVALIVAINTWGVWRVDPLQAFQSPYWQKLPQSSQPLLDVLKANGITRVWLNHWAAFPLMFDARTAGQDLIAYDWYDVQAGGIDRFPEYLPLVRAAARPAFVLVTDEAQPALEQRLQQMGVSYQEYRVAPYVVVVPTSRKVDPSEVTADLDYRY